MAIARWRFYFETICFAEAVVYRAFTWIGDSRACYTILKIDLAHLMLHADKPFVSMKIEKYAATMPVTLGRFTHSVK